jgi:hypothetical protein
VLSACLAPHIAGAQEPAASDAAPNPAENGDRQPKPGEEAGGDAEKPRAGAITVQEIPGDVVFLKSGTKMTGVQVLRSTAEFHEVQVMADLTIQIPRRQVERIEYDDIDPLREKLERKLFPEQQEVTMASGERVTSALNDKLQAPVSAEALSYKNRDFAEILDELKTGLAVDLRVHPSVRDLQPRRRAWTIDVPADHTLLAFLREDLVGAFDFIDVIFEADHIIVLTKEAAQKRAAHGETPARTPAPSPEEQAAPPQ